MLEKLKFKSFLFLVPSVFILGASFAYAEEIFPAKQVLDPASVDEEIVNFDSDVFLNNLKDHFPPESKIADFEHSGISDIYYFRVDGQALMFANDGKYILNGGFFDMENGGVNLLDDYKSKFHVEILQSFKDEDKIIYTPIDKDIKGVVTVFTDPSCPYCTKFHNKMDEYLNLGIKVEYLPFPRGAQSGPGYTDTLKTWCAKDQETRKKLMSAAKNGNNPPILVNQKIDDACLANFTKLLKMNEGLGITGTPAVFLENGKQAGGYIEPKALLKEIIKNEKEK